MAINRIRPTCPDCGRKFRPVEVMAHATTTARRTCCGWRWQLVITPMREPTDKWRIDRVEIARIKGYSGDYKP